MKEKQKVEDQSLIVQTALKAQDSPALWILDSGCSGHMTGDKNKFFELQEYDGGSVKFGNNGEPRLLEKARYKSEDSVATLRRKMCFWSMD